MQAYFLPMLMLLVGFLSGFIFCPWESQVQSAAQFISQASVRFVNSMAAPTTAPTTVGTVHTG
jgi:hypothetical protein